MEPRPVADEPVARLGMWVFLVTDAASFGALLLACAVLRASATTWTAHPLDLRLAAVATLALVGSSLTLMRRRLVATLVLGAIFVVLQALEYATLARHGVGFGTDRAASIFFAATGWHGLHVIAGLIVLASVRRSSAAALFWQFVDAVWIVLFTAFYLAPRLSTPLAILVGIVAAVAFAAVVAFPMKLRSEPRAVKVGFVLPLAFPVLFIVALVADALTRGPRP